MSEAVHGVMESSQKSTVSRWPKHWIAAAFLLLTVVVGIVVGRPLYHSWSTQRSKDFARQCRKLRQAKDWEKLARISDQWKRWDKWNSDAILFRAEAAQAVGDLELTADLLNSIPAGNPKRLAALIERTSLLFGPLNNPLEGVLTCQQVLELEPRAFAIHQRLIDFYAFTLRQEELLRQIYRSIELGCEPVEAYVYLMLADVLTFQNGFELTNRWLAADISEETFLVARTIHLWKNLSMEASPSEETKEKLKLAEKLLREYLEKYPSNLAVLTFFANLALNAGDTEQVRVLLERFPESRANDSRYWRFKGWLHAANDEHQEAESAYLESLRLYPFSWPVRHELADTFRRNRDFARVAQTQELALFGKQLRQELMEIPDARAVSKGLLAKIRNYAAECGDDFVSDAITRRLANLRD